MRIVHAVDVEDAWWQLQVNVRTFQEEDSRTGRVLVSRVPVTTLYENPTRRVLLDPRRDANPFFHVVESLWMLAGWDHPYPLDIFVRDFGARFAEDGVVHGAYGMRWRDALGYDQLDVIVAKLRKNPQDRQCVLQMWDATAYCDDLRGDWKDRPCNTHAYFRVNDGRLDMTVCCRSNDAVWGAYGANAVHFSILQEYLARRIGVAVGCYWQVSNNFHVYLDVWEKINAKPRVAGQLSRMPKDYTPEPLDLRYEDEIGDFVDFVQSGAAFPAFRSSWLKSTAANLVRAHRSFKEGDLAEAMSWAQNISDEGWRLAAKQWLERRNKKIDNIVEIRRG